MNGNGFSGTASIVESADFPKISHPKKRAFLAAFSRCGSLSQAARRAGIDRRTHYNWLKDDYWYVQAFQQAVIFARSIDGDIYAFDWELP